MVGKKRLHMLASICIMIFSLLCTSMNAEAKVVTVVDGIKAVKENTSSTSSNYHSAWQYWSAGASKYSWVRKGGCRIVAYSKLIKEAGWAGFNNPDEFYEWGLKRKHYVSGYAGEQKEPGAALKEYVEEQGGSVSYKKVSIGSKSKETVCNEIMNHLKNGDYVILCSSEHFAYVGQQASLKYGEPVVLDSWMSWSYSPYMNVTYKDYTDVTYTNYRVFSVSGGFSEDDDKVDYGKISFDNVYVKSVSDNTASVRADVTSDGNLYKEAGVYWGTTANLGEKVGFDTSKNSKLTFIEVAFDGSEGPTLQKGTTYYYQFYAVRNDGTVDKDSTVRSFTTTGDSTNPVIEEAYITDLDHTGYNIVCKVSDNVGVVRISFPTWTAYNDQDDIASDWYNNEAIVVSGNGTYTYRIDTSKHNNEYGIYHTHIYAYDAAGNYTIYHLNNNDVPRYMPFADVKLGAWYFNTIADVYEKGFMSGKGADSFDPNAKITRGEVTSVIYNIENKPFVSYVGQFPDVPDGAWYTKPVIWAYRNSIVSGYGNGKFGVSDNVTREQLAKMLYSYAQYKGYDTTYNADAINNYADSSKVSNWAQPAMNWAISKGIMSGKGNAGADLSTYKLDPLGTATRAECASMINKFSELK